MPKQVAALSFAALWLLTSLAHAAVQVQVLETDPPGDVVTLARNQNFYLHLHYETDTPVHIWAQPFFQGKPAHAGSNTSITYDGQGEAIGWFFFMPPGDRVDEIRISAGDGSRRGTKVVTTYPIQISGSEEPATDHTDPEWVTRLNAQAAAVQRADYERRMSTPPSAGDIALYNGFMLLMLIIGILAFVAPAWGLWRWRGGWRVAAAVPAGLMAFVVLRICIDTARDPTSHNLWPFEILQAGTLGVIIMFGLALVRKLRGAQQT